jgi:hypothetical protein
MQRTFGGYTLIEVMIFLAVSSVMLAVTIVAIKGQQAHTEFITTMNDVDTKFQQWIDQVVNGFSGSTAATGSGDYKCQLGPGGPNASPELVSTPGAGNDLGANPACIFLGKALQVNSNQSSTDSGHIYAYSILGRRTYISGGQEATADNLKHANPVAAVFGDIDLTEDYKIPQGVRVLSVKSTTAGIPDSRMAGFFNSFNSGNTANGSSSLLAVQFPFNQNRGKDDNQVLKCLELKATCNANPPAVPDNLWPMSKWQICFDNQKDDERALVTIVSSNGFGASVQINTGLGAAVCS